MENSKLRRYYELRGEDFMDRTLSSHTPPPDIPMPKDKHFSKRQLMELPWFPRWIKLTTITTGMCGPAVYNSLLYIINTPFDANAKEVCTFITREPFHLWDKMRDNWGSCFDELGSKKCKHCRYRRLALNYIRLYGSVRKNREKLNSLR